MGRKQKADRRRGDSRERKHNYCNEETFVLFEKDATKRIRTAGLAYLLKPKPPTPGPAPPAPAQGQQPSAEFLQHQAAEAAEATYLNERLEGGKRSYFKQHRKDPTTNAEAREETLADEGRALNILLDKCEYQLKGGDRDRVVACETIVEALHILHVKYGRPAAGDVSDLLKDLQNITLASHKGDMVAFMENVGEAYRRYQRACANQQHLQTPDSILLLSILRNVGVGTVTTASPYYHDVSKFEERLTRGEAVHLYEIERDLVRAYKRLRGDSGDSRPDSDSSDSESDSGPDEKEEKAHSTADDLKDPALKAAVDREVQRILDQQFSFWSRDGGGGRGRGRGRGRGGTRGRGRGGGRGGGGRGGRKGKMQCHRCKGFGHFARDCATEEEYDESHHHYGGWDVDYSNATDTMDFVNLDEATLTTIADIVSKRVGKSIGPGALVTILSDGGSTCHLTPFRWQLHNYRKVEGEHVYMNAHKVKIEGRGDLLLILTNARGDQRQLWLRNVAHVPSSKGLLLSESAVMRAAWEEHKKNTNFVKGSKAGEFYAFFTIGKDKFKVRANGRLYFIDATIVPPEEATELNNGPVGQEPSALAAAEPAAAPKAEPARAAEPQEASQVGLLADAMGRRDAVAVARTLHALFAHTSAGQIATLIRERKVNLPDDFASAVCAVRPEEIGCDGCGLHKGTKKHPRKQERKMAVEGPVWHMDVSGAYTDKTTENEAYLNCTVAPKGMSFMAEMRGKQPSKVLRQKKKLYEKLAREPMELLAHDRGPEYMGQKFQRACEKLGVVSVPGAPDSSKGPAENRIKIAQDRGLASHSEANAPAHLKLKAIKYANDVGNFMPSEADGNDGMSAFERTTGQQPPLHKIHVWGCRAYARLPKPQRRKGQRRSRRVVFVGFADDMADGWKFYDPATRRFIVSRSATFHDTVLYYHAHPKGGKTSSKPTRPAGGAVVYAKEERYGILPPVRVSVSGDGNVVAQRLDELEAEDQQEEEEEPPGLYASDSDSDDEEEAPPQRDGARGDNGRPRRVTARPAQFDPFAYDLARQHERANATYHGEPELPIPRGLRREDVVIPDGYEGLEGNVHKEYFLGAMGKELRSFEENGTFQRQLRSEAARQGKTIIPSRWVFAVKCDSKGFVVRFKARLVAKGFRQRHGVDYDETFAPTPNWSSVLLLTALTLVFGWVMHQLDAETAFQIPKLDKTVAMEPPQGTVDSNSRWIWELLKCLYGLKQSGRYWNKHVHAFLLKCGFVQLHADPCVYVKRNKAGKTACAVAVHVDDFQLAAPRNKIAAYKKELSSGDYKVKDLGELSWYLGVQFRWAKNRRSVELSQADYVQEVLEKYGMADCNPVSTPALAGVHLSTPDSPPTQEEETFMRGKNYRGVVGCIQYLAGKTRVELKQVAGELARFQEAPRKVHWQAAMRVLQYLKGTADYVMRFDLDAGSSLIVGHSDSNHAPAGGMKDKRQSTSGATFTMLGGTISAASRRQSVTAKSTCEAELIALASAAQEAMWLTGLLKELGLNPPPMKLYCDNEGTVQVSKNRMMSRKIKHLEVDYFIMRDYIEQNKLEVLSIPTDKNISDIMTKPLGRNKFARFRAALGVRKPSLRAQ